MSLRKSEGYAIITVLSLMVVCLFLPYLSGREVKTMEEVYPQIMNVAASQKLQPQESKFIRRFYHLSEEQYQTAYVFAKEGAMNVEELAVFEAVDQKQGEGIKQACEQRIQDQIKSFTGYGERQLMILKKAQIKQYGTLVLCIIFEDVDTILPMIVQNEEAGQ